MRLPTSVGALLSLSLSVSLYTAQTAWALHESDVGVVDWHKHLIGVPLSSAVVTAPSFLRVNGSKSVIVTATGNNVLAALEPEDGSVLWRQIFDPEDRIAGYYKSSKTIATLSGPGGATLRTFHALTGTLLLERRLHDPSFGALSEPSHLGKQVLFSSSDDDETLYVLSNGCTVSSINGTSGDTLWSWTSPDQGSLTIYSSLVLTRTALLAIGLSKSTASFTLHATSLALSTGELIHTTGIPSSIADPLTQIAVLSLPLPISKGEEEETKPIILWLEQSTLRFLPLSPTLKDKPRPLKGAGFERILDVGLSAHGQAVVSRNDGSAFVVQLSAGKAGGAGGGVDVAPAWEFADSANSPAHADSIYTGGTDALGRPTVARVFWSHLLLKASADVFAVQAPAQTQDGKVTGKEAETASARPFAFSFDTKSHGVISHVALDGPNPSSNTHARLLVTTTTGAVQLWSSPSLESNTPEEPQLEWTREESLAAVVVAEFVELPERVSSAGVGGGEDGGDKKDAKEEGFVARLGRQVRDAQDFPQYVVHFIKRFVTGSYASSTSSASPSFNNSQRLSNAATTPSSSQNTLPPTRDTFGFRQLIITATLFGKIYAIDSATGTVVWSRVLGMGWVGQAGMGGRVLPVKMFVVKSVGDVGEGGEGPEVVLVGQRRADNSLVDTVVFHVNALTGADARAGQAQQDGDVLEGQDVVSGPLVEAYLLNADDKKIVVLLDEFLQVYLYPETPSTQATFSKSINKLSFPLRTNIDTRHRIVGHKISQPPADQSHHRAVAHPTWSLSFPEGEDMQALIPQTHNHNKGEVASVGKVLGSRQTLYKYLDERLFVVHTVARKSGGDTMCGVYVVDGAKGTVVYHAEVKATSASTAVGGRGAGGGGGKGKGGCDVKTSLVENWLVYHYYESEVAGGSVGGAKGYRMVSVEFYEGSKADDKIESSSLSAYSNDTLNFSVYEQAYVFPSAITALATTTTKFGISGKDLIVATTNRKIQSFPRRILDPRRPSRKTTAEEQEEFLIQYDPLIPNDPRRALSHNYDVANVQKIITSPALLESTSLVFAFGLDMFLTRVAPSNTFDVLSENFNKVQLVLTVTGLLVAILITRPMVKRKSLKEKWYN